MKFEGEEYPLKRKVRIASCLHEPVELPIGTIVKLHHLEEDDNGEVIACEVIGGQHDGLNFVTSTPALDDEEFYEKD